MNDEIKEILKCMKNYGSTTELALLDYITNLQKENERLKTKTKEQSLLLIDYQDMEQKLEHYKSRIEKAIEYIEEMQVWCIEFDDYGVITDGLLNILKGEDNE